MYTTRNSPLLSFVGCYCNGLYLGGRNKNKVEQLLPDPVEAAREVLR